MLHVGIRVVDPAKSDAFYKDILGFRLQWKGGPNGYPLRVDFHDGAGRA